MNSYGCGETIHCIQENYKYLTYSLSSTAALRPSGDIQAVNLDSVKLRQLGITMGFLQGGSQRDYPGERPQKRYKSESKAQSKKDTEEDAEERTRCPSNLEQ